MQNPDDIHLVAPTSLEDLIKAIQDAKREHEPREIA
jgi:hypothetical protein